MRRSLLLLAACGTLVRAAAANREAAAVAPAWEHGPGWRRLPLSVSAGGRVGFTVMPAARTGVAFTNHLAQSRYLENLNLLNGSGVALGDFDSDGRCDVYLCGLERPSGLYRNLGDWRFQDVALETGAACPGQTSTGAAFADVNGDGHLDLLVNSMGGPNALLLNTGQGTFTNITAAAGLVSTLGSTSLALADAEGDGDLDLYVAHYGVNSILRSGGQISFRMVSGRPVATGRHARRIRFIGDRVFELGEPDGLFLNDGAGRFTAVSWTGGTFRDEEDRPLTEEPWDQTLSVLWCDLNGDGAPDLYTCGDASTPDRFWLNDGRGRFRALPALALRITPYFSMAVVAADLDRDGWDDLFVTDMLSRQHELVLTQRGTMHEQPRRPGDVTFRYQTRRNALLRARGDGTYEELAWYAGAAGSEWAWGALNLDVDLDGWEDLLISNGIIHNMDDLDTQERIRRMGPLSVAESRKSVLLFDRLDTANLAFHNQHDLTFVERGREWGFDSKRISNGMALGDLDGDGDLDVVVNCFEDGALLLRNDCAAPRLAVRLHGQPPNRFGIGARVRVCGGPVVQEQEMLAGGRYMSSDEPLLVFATGLAPQLAIEVRWRSGRRTTVPAAQPNSLYVIEEPADPPPAAAPAAAPAPDPWLADVSDRLPAVHEEVPVDDFALQPLVPYQLSRLGPGVGWFDLDGDGHEELILGADAGRSIKAFRPVAPANRFEPLPGEAPPLPGDIRAVTGWVDWRGQRFVLLGLASLTREATNAPLLAALAWREGRWSPPQLWHGADAAGPVAVADYDGDGDLDVFVGGRPLTGRYPEPADSLLLRQTEGELAPDPEATRRFQRLGLVAGACWTDVNADGWPDLALACEWGPIRLFLNERGQLREVTAPWGLAEPTGLWSGLAPGDFDGDGRLDLVAGNWSLNSPWRATAAEPARLSFGDFNADDVVDVIEAYTVPGLGLAPRREFDVLATALPFLKERFASRKDYARATVAQILGPEAARAQEWQATTLASMVFLNRGDRFEARPLPAPAQWAPVFGVAVADFDGDGHQDLALAQNLQATRPDLDPLEAGRGLVLRGDGRGGFTPLAGTASGLILYGEQRACAVADFDGDGRTDLLVSRNGAAVGLFQNRVAPPGVRVRLRGPVGNPDGLGAVVRLLADNRTGAARIMTAGTGWGSQDSATLVMTLPGANPTRLQVRWPGGTVTETPLPAGVRTVCINPQGQIVP